MKTFLTATIKKQFTNYTGIDPEPILTDPETSDVLAPGIDRRNNYFTAKAYTFGINLAFLIFNKN